MPALAGGDIFNFVRRDTFVAALYSGDLKLSALATLFAPQPGQPRQTYCSPRQEHCSSCGSGGKLKHDAAQILRNDCRNRVTIAQPQFISPQ
jgi:hypothetical protein